MRGSQRHKEEISGLCGAPLFQETEYFIRKNQLYQIKACKVLVKDAKFSLYMMN